MQFKKLCLKDLWIRGRYLSYLELKKELDYLESRQNSKAYENPGSKDKYISKFVKEMKNGKVVY